MFQFVSKILCRPQDAKHNKTVVLKVAKWPIGMHQIQ
jgi:hypothetical protein